MTSTTKVTREQVQQYQELINCDFSQRQACAMLGIPRSTMQDALKVHEEEDMLCSDRADGPKILFFDLETAAAIAACFGRFKQYLSQDNIIKEGGWILCYGYRWLGEDVAHVKTLYPDECQAMDDSRLVGFLWELFEEADVVVAHNNQRFDFPMFKARCLLHGFPPPPTVKVIDTYQMAKRNFRLPNNKLDSIAAALGLERKKDSGGIETWIDAQEGSVDAMEHLAEYCEHDVNLLHDIYQRLAPFGTASTFNAANYYSDDEERCNTCGSTDLASTGRHVTTNISKFEELRCRACGAISRTRKSLHSKEKRSNLHMKPALSG